MSNILLFIPNYIDLFYEVKLKNWNRFQYFMKTLGYKKDKNTQTCVSDYTQYLGIRINAKLLVRYALFSIYPSTSPHECFYLLSTCNAKLHLFGSYLGALTNFNYSLLEVIVYSSFIKYRFYLVI